MTPKEQADLDHETDDSAICGEAIEHDIDREGFNEEGTCVYWHCRRCDAEGFEETDKEVKQ